MSTYANVGSFLCSIKVCGTDGCQSVRNPNAVVLVAGRRLLADSGSASFQPTGLSVSGTSGNLAAASKIQIASTLMALIFAFVIAAVYQF